MTLVLSCHLTSTMNQNVITTHLVIPHNKLNLIFIYVIDFSKIFNK